ncbi:MAG: response regulator [bacterium]
MAGEKILVIEDSPSMLEMIKDALRDEGYESWTASDGFQALRDLEEIDPDLIITDINMPKVDGLEFCEAIRGRLETRDIPFIFLSAVTDENTVQKGRKIGAEYFIAKPFKKEDLINTVKRVLE